MDVLRLDDQLDRAERKETLTIVRGDEIKLALPPKVVHVLELKQTRKGETYSAARTWPCRRGG